MKKLLPLLVFLSLNFFIKAQFTAPCTNQLGTGVAHSIFFLNKDTGYVAGENAGKGVIIKTTDGGNNWTNIYTSATNLEWVYDVAFTNVSTGFASCNNGKIIKTTDGGTTWNVAANYSATVTYFNALSFPTSAIGYSVGEGSSPKGPIYKTTDGGNTWTAQTSNTSSFLDDVFFVDANTGYAAGDVDVIKTTNGGNTWTKIYSNAATKYNTVFCTDANTCYISGGLNDIKKTTDGGTTWTSLSFPPVSPPYCYHGQSIYFTDSQTGYMAGVYVDTTGWPNPSSALGTIFKTTNAGQTWNIINTAANNTLLQNRMLDCITFVNSQIGYTSGDDGVILKTTNGGTPPCNLSLSVTITSSTCGQATGTASVTVTNGTAPYTYAWTNGDTISLADSLAHGLYMVYVTDASGCTAQAPAMINDAGAPTISVTLAKNLTCNGSEDGAVAVSVNGGTQPYTYLWADGNTTNSQSGLDAGPHQVSVTDANGCMANKIIILTEPAAITLQDTIQNASCGNADGAAGVLPSGGTSPYTYSWSTAATTQVIGNVAAGNYSVMVTDKNGCTKEGMGTIANLGAAVIKIDSIHPVRCSTGAGDIFISVSGGSPPYTYVWNTGATTKNLIGVPVGNYGVTVYSNGNPCTGALSGYLPPFIPQAPAICIVTVDTGTGKNVCAFVKDSLANLHFKQYNFFRESTTAGVYQWLGSAPSNYLSVWADQSANPLSRAWRYKITAEDSCGNESPVTGHHKTIHCAANIGVGNVVNLAWDDYEGFSYGTFIVYRYTPATGWDSLDAVPSNLHAYTDLNPPLPITNVNYFIAVANPNQCIPTTKYPAPNAVNLNSSKSNVYKVNPSPTTDMNENALANSISIYPNPSNGTFVIASEAKQSHIEIYSLVGKKVFEKSFNQKQETVSLNEPNGIYLLHLKTEKGMITKKIILQK